MASQLLRGFRDAYPKEEAKVNYLKEKIAAVCDLFGYEEIEGPSLEQFSLYAAKSSEEIISDQAFVFTDRGGQRVVLRPEFTPSLARMVAARQGELTWPLRWWQFGRFWRYERPQKGRGREFYQWNCDILGLDSLEAEEEILILVITFLQSLGLTSSEVQIEISDRQFVETWLSRQGIAAERLPIVLKFLDRLPQLEEKERNLRAKKLGLSSPERKVGQKLTEVKEIPALDELLKKLGDKGLGDWLAVRPSLVRGFAYYNGFVFEVSDRGGEYRAILGGGRYNNLVERVGGKPVSGVGFALGDMVLLTFLGAKGLLPAYRSKTRVCVIALGQEASAWAREIVEALRQAGVRTVFYGVTQNPGQGLKFTHQKGIAYAVLIGPNECRGQTMTLKNLESGDQTTLPREEGIRKIATAEETISG